MKRVVDEVIFAADVNVTVTRTINTEQSGRSCNTLQDVCVRLSEHELMTVWRSACRCLSMYREDPVEAARVLFFFATSWASSSVFARADGRESAAWISVETHRAGVPSDRFGFFRFSHWGSTTLWNLSNVSLLIHLLFLAALDYSLLLRYILCVLYYCLSRSTCLDPCECFLKMYPSRLSIQTRWPCDYWRRHLRRKHFDWDDVSEEGMVWSLLFSPFCFFAQLGRDKTMTGLKPKYQEEWRTRRAQLDGPFL